MTSPNGTDSALTAGIQRPPWQQPVSDGGAARADLTQLGARRTWDVCVVGAGITGLLTALELLERGRSVIVLDRAEPGGGESGKTTAHLTAMLDTRYAELQRMHGSDVVSLVIDSHRTAIAHLERVANLSRIDCDFERTDAFLFAARDEHRETLEREHHAVKALLGCRLIRRAPLPFAAGPALHLERQARFEPGLFLSGVARRIREFGGLIAAPAHVLRVDDTGTECRIVTARDQVVEARQVVIATDSPINDVVTLHTKQAPYRSYALALELETELPNALFWDTEDPYHYVRTSPGRRAGDRPLLIVGGEDHKVGQEDDPEARWERLLAWTRERFPMAKALLNRWSGQILEPNDGIAFIGRNPGQENVFVATGFSGNGMTYGAISAMLLSDLISGVDNAWADVYSPSRKPASLPAMANYVADNANVAAQYLDWVRAGDVASADEISADEGAVLRRGLTKLAVYRDASGNLHRFSATCPHLGGVVAWNRAEKTWDCPCHGSRFDCFGKVLNGPAIEHLKPVADDDAADAAAEADTTLRGVALS